MAADFTLTIGGVDRTSLLIAGSLRWSDELNTRSSLSFSLITTTGGYRPTDGESVVLVDHSSATVFGGVLVAPAEALLFDGEVLTHNQHDCQAVSFDMLADRALVAASYDAQTLKAIAQDIVATTTLAADGVTATDYVDVGPTITITFNYVYANECFDRLCELAGFAWWIDADKKLHLQSRAANVAPYGLSDASPRCTVFRVARNRDQYRNVQYVRAGVDLTSSRTETFVGDGTRKTFTLAYPVGVVPSAVTVDAAAKTIGIKGVETGKDWYWNKSSSEISQDDGATALSGAQTLAVTYQGEFPIIVSARNDTEIAARADIEGGSGEYPAIDTDANINASTVALEKAQGLLARHGAITDVLEWETEDAGLRAGQLIQVAFAKHAISGEYLIQTITATDRDDVNHTFVYGVRAISGDGVGGWAQFYQRLLGAQRSFVVRDNEVLLLLRSAFDGLVLGDAAVAATSTPERRIGYGLIGSMEVAA